MSLKDIDGTAITTKYVIRFFNIFVASVTKRIFVTKKRFKKSTGRRPIYSGAIYSEANYSEASCSAAYFCYKDHTSGGVAHARF